MSTSVAMAAAAPSTKARVSVLVPTRNEESNIARCLDSLTWADEIYVVDSASTDATQQIARAKGANVVTFRWDGRGPKKRNWALDNLPWRNDWVLFLDADEEVSPALRAEIITTIESPDACDGLIVTSRFVFLGRLIRHGAPIRKLILCRHRMTRYERVDVPQVSAYDMEIHEYPVVQGRVGRFKAELIHHHFENLHRHFERHNVYSDWDANLWTRDLDSEVQPSLFGNAMERRRWLKRTFMKLPGKSLVYFIYSYVLRGGFLDGKPGFIFNVLRAFYWFQISVKMYELRRQDVTNGAATPGEAARAPSEARPG